MKWPTCTGRARLAASANDASGLKVGSLSRNSEDKSHGNVAAGAVRARASEIRRNMVDRSVVESPLKSVDDDCDGLCIICTILI